MATYILIFKNRIKVTVPDVVSETEVDEEVYDLTNYRDDVSNGAQNSDSPEGPHVHKLWENSETGSPGTADDLENPPALPGAVSPGILIQNTNDDSGAETINTRAYYAISDPAAHIAPRNEMKMRTKLKLWSAAAGGGTLLYSAWSDRLESWGAATEAEYV